MGRRLGLVTQEEAKEVLRNPGRGRLSCVLHNLEEAWPCWHLRHSTLVNREEEIREQTRGKVMEGRWGEEVSEAQEEMGPE